MIRHGYLIELFIEINGFLIPAFNHRLGRVDKIDNPVLGVPVTYTRQGRTTTTLFTL